MSRAAKPVQALDAFDTLFVDMQTADFMAEQRKVAVRRIAQAVPGLPTRSSCRPHLEVGAAVVANSTAWRPAMARPTRTVSAVDAFDILFPSEEIKSSIEARRRTVVRALAFGRPLDREQLTDLEALRLRMGCELAAVDAALRLCGPRRRTNRWAA